MHLAEFIGSRLLLSAICLVLWTRSFSILISVKSRTWQDKMRNETRIFHNSAARKHFHYQTAAVSCDKCMGRATTLTCFPKVSSCSINSGDQVNFSILADGSVNCDNRHWKLLIQLYLLICSVVVLSVVSLATRIVTYLICACYKWPVCFCRRYIL